MEKLYMAIGDFYNEEGAELIDVPADEQEIYAKIDDIIARNPMSTVLSDEDVAILRAYLPAIGCDETSRDENGSLQGKAVVTKKAAGKGIEVEAKGALDVESRWHAARKQWTGHMYVTRTGGEAQVKELTFEFFNLSIGTNPEGQFIVLYSAHFERTFNDPYHLSDFNGGGTAQGSRYDISKHNQWGFYMHAQCKIRTDDGTLIV